MKLRFIDGFRKNGEKIIYKKKRRARIESGNPVMMIKKLVES
jgi:hypothetical protein